MATAGDSTDDDLLAAELAIGLLDGAERHNAEARLAHDAAFAAAKAEWDDHIGAIVTGVASQPRAIVWDRIAKRLREEDGYAAPSGLRQISRWRIATFAASAVAILALVFVALSLGDRRSSYPPAAPRLPVLAAAMTGEAAGSLGIAYYPDRRRIVTVPVRLNSGSNRQLQLWLIIGKNAPRSLGLVSATRPASYDVSEAAVVALQAGSTLAMSVEPLGGSPTGKPTGPVILKGRLSPANG